MVNDTAKNDGSLNELAASIASKLARNAVPLTDPQPSVPQEWGSFVERQDANIFPPQGAVREDGDGSDHLPFAPSL